VGEPGTDPGQFHIAHNICCDGRRWVYVADLRPSRPGVRRQRQYETQWNNMHRPFACSSSTAPSRASTSRDRRRHGVNYDMPNVGTGQHLHSQGEMLARLGERPAGRQPGSHVAARAAVDSRGDIYVGECRSPTA